MQQYAMSAAGSKGWLGAAAAPWGFDSPAVQGADDDEDLVLAAEDPAFDSWLIKAIADEDLQLKDPGTDSGSSPGAPQLDRSASRCPPAAPFGSFSSRGGGLIGSGDGSGGALAAATALPRRPGTSGSTSTSADTGAGAPARGCDASAALPSKLGTGDRFVRVPSGQELVQVGPGLYEMRPIKAAAAAESALHPMGAVGRIAEAAFAPSAPMAAGHVPAQPLAIVAAPAAAEGLLGRGSAGGMQLDAFLGQAKLKLLHTQPPGGFLEPPQLRSAKEQGPSAAEAAGSPVLQGAEPAGPTPHGAAKASLRKRASSQRFRERQKGLIAELENELVDKLRHLEVLEQENGVLKLRAKLLERAVQGREEQLEIMQTHGVIWRDNDAPDARGRRRGGPGGSASGGGPGGAAAAQDVTEAAGDSSAGAAACFAAAVQCVVARRCRPERAAEIAGWFDAALPTVDQIKALLPSEVRVLWQAFVRRASQGLVELQQEREQGAGAPAAGGAGGAGFGRLATRGEEGAGGGGCGAQPRLHALVSRYMGITKYILLLNPAVTYPLVGLNLDTLLPQPTPDSFWRNVLAQMPPTAEQMEDAMAIHELITLQSNRILAERAMLQARLGGPTPGGVDEATMLRNTTNAMQTADALAANIKKEHTLRLLLECFIYGRVMEAEQLARIAVFSYPVIPDIASMMRVLAEDAMVLAPHAAGRRIFGESTTGCAAAAGGETGAAEAEARSRFAATLNATAGAVGESAAVIAAGGVGG